MNKVGKYSIFIKNQIWSEQAIAAFINITHTVVTQGISIKISGSEETTPRAYAHMNMYLSFSLLIKKAPENHPVISATVAIM